MSKKQKNVIWYLLHLPLPVGLCFLGRIVVSVYYQSGSDWYLYNAAATFRAGLTFLTCVFLPLLMLEISFIFFLEDHYDNWERMSKRIACVALITVILEMLIWLISWIMAWCGLEQLSSMTWESLWEVLQPQAVFIPVILFSLATVRWYLLRRKNKQVAVSAPVSETADTPAE